MPVANTPIVTEEWNQLVGEFLFGDALILTTDCDTLWRNMNPVEIRAKAYYYRDGTVVILKGSTILQEYKTITLTRDVEFSSLQQATIFIFGNYVSNVLDCWKAGSEHYTVCKKFQPFPHLISEYLTSPSVPISFLPIFKTFWNSHLYSIVCKLDREFQMKELTCTAKLTLVRQTIEVFIPFLPFVSKTEA